MNVDADTMQLLRDNPLMSGLDDKELDAVAKCVVPWHYRKGDVVIREGEPGECLYIVRTGRVRVEKTAKGRRITLAELEPGSPFGEMSLLDTFPTSATVSALEDTELLSIGRLDLNVLLNWDPLLASKLWRSFTHVLSLRLRDTNERMLERYGEDALRS